jgi:hypothetical protein
MHDQAEMFVAGLDAITDALANLGAKVIDYGWARNDEGHTIADMRADDSAVHWWVDAETSDGRIFRGTSDLGNDHGVAIMEAGAACIRGLVSELTPRPALKLSDVGFDLRELST